MLCKGLETLWSTIKSWRNTFCALLMGLFRKILVNLRIWVPWHQKISKMIQNPTFNKRSPKNSEIASWFYCQVYAVNSVHFFSKIRDQEVTTVMLDHSNWSCIEKYLDSMLKKEDKDLLLWNYKGKEKVLKSFLNFLKVTHWFLTDYFLSNRDWVFIKIKYREACPLAVKCWSFGAVTICLTLFSILI